MRLAFITPRFGASAPSPPEQLAEELARRAPSGWSVSILTTSPGGSGSGPEEESTTQEHVVVRRFPADPMPERAARSGERVTAAGLLEHVGEDPGRYDLLLLFGSTPALCRAAANVAPERTVLLPFTAAQPETDPEAAAMFDVPAAFLFGSEAEEVRVLGRYPALHRRMRETVGGSLMLRKAANPEAFRRHSGIRRRYLFHCRPLESGRGIEEAIRFFCTYRDRHPRSQLDLLLVGPSAVRVPERPDVRIVLPRRSRDALDALAGALMVLVPERLAGFADSAAEPFAQGTPLLVNAAATRLVQAMNASNGGLYYRNYEEFEAILDLALRDPALIARLGASGRRYLEARNSWDALMKDYDRAFRSFCRPALPGARPRPAPSRPPAKRASVPAPAEKAPKPEAPPAEEPPQSEEPPQPEAPAEAPAPEPVPAPPPAADPEGAKAAPDDLPSFFRSPIRR